MRLFFWVNWFMLILRSLVVFLMVVVGVNLVLLLVVVIMDGEVLVMCFCIMLLMIIYGWFILRFLMMNVKRLLLIFGFEFDCFLLSMELRLLWL